MKKIIKKNKHIQFIYSVFILIRIIYSLRVISLYNNTNIIIYNKIHVTTGDKKIKKMKR